MGTVQILAAIFAMAGVAFLLTAKGGHRLMRILGIVLILQGILIFGVAWVRGL